MKHPNQSFIDNFFRPNPGPQGNPTYFYSKEFLEEKKKEKFEMFLESFGKPKENKANKIIEASKKFLNRGVFSGTKQNYLVEETKKPDNLPLTFTYNGLAYSYVPSLNVYINMNGHVISIAQATAFMEMSDFDEVVDTSLDSSYDGSSRIKAQVIPSPLPESRSLISSFAWSYQYQPTYDIAYTSSGSTLNYFASSADLSTSSPWSWPTTSGYSRTTGYTAPDGTTTAWDIYTTGNASRKDFSQSTFGEIGATFILSYYLDLSNSVLGGLLQRPVHGSNQWIQIDSTTGDVIPVTPDGFGNARVAIPVGATGWTRFTYRWYNNTDSAQMNLSVFWYGGGPTLSTRIWGPQLEKKP